MLEVLLPVALGGAIAIIAGLVGPPYLHGLQVAAEKKKRSAEKFEELVAALYEHHHWLEILRNSRVYGKVRRYKIPESLIRR